MELFPEITQILHRRCLACEHLDSAFRENRLREGGLSHIASLIQPLLVRVSRPLAAFLMYPGGGRVAIVTQDLLLAAFPP